jgi:NAD(P)-dependent dehydrogenase (short-subunit alcohol dehydrogenase family)
MKLRGKTAIVTGGASGIGEAAVRRFAAEGANVVIADMSPSGAALAQALADAGHEVRFARTDVTREEEVRELVAKAAAAFGRLDIMVANAGIGHAPVPVEQLELQTWQRTLDVNLTGVFLCNRYAIAHMKAHGGGGAIVNVASILGHVGMAGAAAYNASKGGVVNLTRSLGVSCARGGIRVNAVCPGFVVTPILDGADPARKAAIAALHPMGRLGTVDEIAAAILFLASDEASFMAGASLMVDGGYTAQ